MELWIFVTLAAAIFQTGRFMLQKRLSMGALDATGSTFARFAYAAPAAWVVVGAYLWGRGVPLPDLSLTFWAYALLGGVSQILATLFVVLLFAQRNFAVGITFKKTEVILTALVGFVVLSEPVSAGGLGAILVGVLGVLLLSKPPELSGGPLQWLVSRAVGLGVGSGLFFAFSAVGYRGASLQLASDDPFIRAGVTLLCVTTAQALGMGLWLALRDPGQLGQVWRARATASVMGLASMAGSLAWFTAFTLQTAAYVQAVGQVELIFSLMVSVLVFKETVTRRELAGMGCLALSILVLILVA
jgi:drug/metabolite transporter (DMT)-like permease